MLKRYTVIQVPSFQHTVCYKQPVFTETEKWKRLLEVRQSDLLLKVVTSNVDQPYSDSFPAKLLEDPRGKIS